ncbi:MAG: hypothetical protein GYA23_05715 [Methanomicrobiales archaeon]|nr:hypothetical protein [Methanomicrobiales archaeon]
MSEYEKEENRSIMPDVLSFGKLDVIMIAVVFLQSLLIAWFMFLIIEGFETSLVFRFLQGVTILFAIMVPVFILLDGFQHLSIQDGFFIPLLLYTFMFTLFNSLIHHTVVFLEPAMILPAIAGGIGFGLVGLGAYHLPRDATKSFAVVTAGITIIFLSTPMILAGLFYVFTGDLSAIPVTHG